MDLREFTYLIALAERGSVSGAAGQLYMAQSSLSQFLQQTESELGVKLFIRTPKGIRPTANGAVFIERLRKITEDYQRAKNELWDNENLRGGKVLLGISSFRGKRMLPGILMRFHERYPEVGVEVVEENSMKLEALLLDGLLDLAVVAMPPVRLKGEVAFLKKDEIFIVARRDHPVMDFARRREDGSRWVELGDAARFGFILSDQSTILGTRCREMFRSEDLRPIVLYDNITAALAVSMASAGMGLAFTYYSYAEPTPDSVFLSVGEAGVFLDLGLARSPCAYYSRAAAALEGVVREIYQTT